MKTAKLALGLIAALALPSCLQNETTITLNKDGSGTIVDESLLGAQMMAMMSQFAQPGQPDPIAEMFSEEKGKEKLIQMGEGVEFVKAEMFEKDGKKGGRFHYKFADIGKIRISPGDSVNSMGADGEPLKDAKKENKIKFAYADGKLKITPPPADFEEMKMDDKEGGDPQQEMMMKQMLGDMRVSIKLVIADGIAQTDATYVEDDTITLFDVKVGKMMEQKEELEKIAETAKTDREAAKAEFAKLEGMKAETKGEVFVTIK